MNEAKQGKKPDNQERDPQVPLGKQEPDEDTNEASGRAKPMLYTCFNDGAGNYVGPTSCGRFVCWRCGATNLIQ